MDTTYTKQAIEDVTLNDLLLFYECSNCNKKSYDLHIEFMDGNPNHTSIKNIRLICENCKSPE